MDAFTFREMRPEDIPATLALRNEVFVDYPLTAEDWAADGVRAAIALQDDEIVGAIPLITRDLMFAGGVAAAAFANAVGTRAALRGRGIGAGMMAAAREFMRERADGLFVYREGERTPGYRFYAKTGHHDLLPTRSYRLSPRACESSPPVHLLVGRDGVGSFADRLLPLFLSTYGPFGGYPRRTISSWERALSSSSFAAIPVDLFLIPARRGDRLAGYALAGVRTAHEDGVVHILEMATEMGDLGVASEVLTGVASVAVERGLGVEMAVSDDDPFVPALLTMGFREEARGTFLMGQILDVPGFFQRHWRDRLPLGGIGLSVATEIQDYPLSSPTAGYPTLTLEMKEGTLHRWLLGRVDLAGRLREGTVSVYGVHGPVVDAVAEAIPWTPWAFHALDWI